LSIAGNRGPAEPDSNAMIGHEHERMSLTGAAQRPLDFADAVDAGRPN
jgi:hypothetical protein